MPKLEVILKLGLGALALALIGYGMSSMGPSHLDYQVAKACYYSAALLIIILAGVWLISSKWSMGIRILLALIIYGAIGAGLATLIGITQNREEMQNQEERKKAYTGRLQPEKKILFSGKDHIYRDLEIGDSGALLRNVGLEGTPIFHFIEVNDIVIEVEDGQLKLSTKIRDKKGQIIAEIIKNEWKVNPQNSWDRNYSQNSLEVRDTTGDIVLQVKLVEDRLQFQAKLYDSTGRGFAIGKSFGPEKRGGIIEQTNPNHPNLIIVSIKPMFKYPSELHLGEFVENH